MPLRFDIAKLEKPSVDQNGYLHADAFVTRSGVFVYHHPDGTTTRELRHPDDVFKAGSLKSIENRPVTDGHPYVGRLDAKNTKQFSVGSVIDKPVNDSEFVRTKIMVNDQGVIDKVMRNDNPVREISCGYNCDTVKESGTFNGEQYDHRQKNIVYNHVAIVDKGRAGPSARLVLDAVDGAVEGIEIELKQDSKKNSDKEKITMKVKIKKDAVSTNSFKQDGFEVEVDESAQDAVEKVLSKMDGAIVHIKTLEQRNDALRGENDQLKAKAEVPPERLAELVQERADLLGVAQFVGVKVDNIDTVKNIELKKLVVGTANKNLNLDDVSEDYIAGSYEGVVNSVKSQTKGLQSLATLREITGNSDFVFNADADMRSPREKFTDETHEMWRKPQGTA